MEKTYAIFLKLSTKSDQILFDAVQGDTGRKIVATILDDDNKPFVPETGTTAEFWTRKQDRNGTQHTAELSGSTVTVHMTAQDLAVPGRTYAAIVLKNGDTILAMMPFYFNVVAIPTGNAVESTSDYQMLQDAVEEAQTATAAAESAAEHAPRVDDTTGYWQVWDPQEQTYVTTDISATGPQGPAGSDGRDGTDGTDGTDGRGIVSVTKTATSGLVDTYTISYTDGTVSTYSVTNGAKGDKGDKGDTGDTGATGPQGLQGIQGIQGPQGETGATGATGATGPAGSDGYSPTATVAKSGTIATITITDKNGTTTASVSDGTTPDISGKEDKTNKVTSLTSSSTDTQYPSAKCVYDIIGDVETLLNALL